MNDHKKKWWILSSSVLLLIIVFVPYVRELCTQYHCWNQESGYTFVGSLGRDEEINLPLLIIELVVVVIISGSYYYFLIKNK